MAPITDLTPFNSIERNERIALSVAEQSMLRIRMVIVVVVKTRRSVGASEHRLDESGGQNSTGFSHATTTAVHSRKSAIALRRYQEL